MESFPERSPRFGSAVCEWFYAEAREDRLERDLEEKGDDDRSVLGVELCASRAGRSRAWSLGSAFMGNIRAPQGRGENSTRERNERKRMEKGGSTEASEFRIFA